MSQEQHNNALMMQLKKHFQLAAEPFSSEASFFFEGAQRKHNLETIRHLASFGDLVLFVTGDKGAGKTHLLKQLEVESADIVRTVYLECNRALQGSQGRQVLVIESSLRLLGLERKEESFDESCARLLHACDSYLALHGRRTLFVYDNADQLPGPQLLALYGFCRKLPEESSLVMLFSGSSTLLQHSKIGANLDQDAWWHQIQMKPFAEQEIQAYLAQALSSAGYQGELELTEQQLKQLTQIGKGLPGRINKVFPSVILEPGLLKIPASRKNKNTSIRVMFGLAGLLVLSFLIVSFQHGVFDRLVPVFSLAPTEKPEAAAVPKVSEPVEPVADAQQLARLALLDAELERQGLSLPAEEMESNSVVDQPISVQEKNSEPENDKSVMSESAPADSLKQTKPEPVQVQEKPQAVSAGKEGPAELERVENSISESSVTTSDSKALEPEKHKTFRSKQWLESQSKQAYIPQILGSFEEQTALNFIQELGQQKYEIFYLETEHKGRPWFVVFYGVFPSKADAQEAIKRAPKRIRNQNPWLRSVDGVLRSYP